MSYLKYPESNLQTVVRCVPRTKYLSSETDLCSFPVIFFVLIAVTLVSAQKPASNVLKRLADTIRVALREGLEILRPYVQAGGSLIDELVARLGKELRKTIG